MQVAEQQEGRVTEQPTGHLADIVRYTLWLQSEGYRAATIYSHARMLRLLAKNCDLRDPESVRAFIAGRHCSFGRKENLVDAYSKFSKFIGIAFAEPRYTREDSLPFIPQQQEIEAIIDASRDLRHGTMLRLLFETGMRVGEASRLEFKDFDFERKTVRVIPEKKSRARELKLSDKLCALLRQVYVQFPSKPLPNPESCRKHMERTRKYLAAVNGNPRFLNIHLHTLRHFRATMLYHTTRDIIHVQHILGHRSIGNTMRYVQLVDWNDEGQFHCKVAASSDEAAKLVEQGFDFVTEIGGHWLFRKRK